MILWLLLGLLVAVVALSIGVLKGAAASDRATRDAASAKADNRQLIERMDGMSSELADLRRESDVKSQQLRDAGIPESPLVATPIRSATTTTTTRPRTTTTTTTVEPRAPAPTSTTTAPPATTTTTKPCVLSVLNLCP